MAEDLTRRLYVENFEQWEKTLSQKKFSDRKLEVKVVERGIILPMRRKNGEWKGGVCDSYFNFIAGFARTPPPGKTTGQGAWCVVESGYIVDRKELVLLDEDVIFGGALIGHFGHFFTECLSRLWYIVKNSDSRLKILFIIRDEICKSWADSFLKLMGIDTTRAIYVQKPMQCRSVTVPEQSQYVWNDFTKEYVLPYQAIKERVTPGKTKKLYLARTNFDAKRVNPGGVYCFNEKYFVDFFAAHGFKIVLPEELSIEEQISLIMGADEIVTTLGTLSHWAIFKKPSAKLISLSRTTKSLLVAQAFIMEAFQIDNYYIVSGSRDFMYANAGVGACMLGSNKYWKEFVADYFGDQIDEDDDVSYFEEALDKYVNFWYKKYANQNETITGSLKDMCYRIYALETQVSKNRLLLSYQTHVASKGWCDWKTENLFSNDIGEKRDIQAIKINFPTHKVYYAVYFNEKEGWSKEIAAPDMAGTTGKNKSITGVRIRLDEAGAKEFDILYRVHKFDDTWTAWAKNGEEILSQGVKLNAIQIKLLACVDKTTN